MIHLFITLDGHAGDFSLHTSITIYAPQAINRMHPNYPDKADSKKGAEFKGQHDRSLLITCVIRQLFIAFKVHNLL